MKNQFAIVAITSVVVGFGIGYLVFSLQSSGTNEMAHQMHDSEMQSSMDAMMASLESKTGDEFDKVFISEMIMHHEGAVQMAQAALKNANHQEIKDLANTIVSAQTKEIDIMQQWQASWHK